MTPNAKPQNRSSEAPGAHREMIDLVYYPEKSIEEVTELVGARALRRGSDYHTCSKSEA
jgi:hypothetical protein